MAVSDPRDGRSAPRLWTFHGGLQLPDERALSCEVPSGPAAVPARLIIPLKQHAGAPARPCVQVGERVAKGQLIGTPEGPVSAAVHASSSGRVIGIAEHPVPHPGGLAGPCVVIETDGEDAWGPPLPPLTGFQELAPALILERLRLAGVVGLGGAAFPTAAKLAPGPALGLGPTGDQRIDTLVINGAECEPYITCDDRLMRERPGRVLEGVRIIRHLVGAARVLIGIEDNKPQAIAALDQALGAAGLGPEVRVLAIPSRYPSGGERQLIRILTGREVPSGGLPRAIGVACVGVSTAAAVAAAVLRGRPLISRLVTLTGRALRSPRNLEVRIGTPMAELVAQCGGWREPPARLICGGPMMGFALGSLDVPATKAVNCILALTPTEAPDPGPARACIRCGRCAAVCPAQLLPQELYWQVRARDFDQARKAHLGDCIECGCCALVCPSQLPLVEYYRFGKDELRSREALRRQADQSRARQAARQARLAREAQERQAHLDRQKAVLAGPAPAVATDAGTAVDPAAAKRALIAAARQRVAAKQAARTAERERPTDPQRNPHEPAAGPATDPADPHQPPHDTHGPDTN